MSTTNEISFKTFADSLAPLETFDSNAFIPDQNVNKKLCDFVLCLAVIYNDSRTLNLIYDIHKESRPEGNFKIRSNWGEFNGIRSHLHKLHIAVLHELFKLIEDNKKCLDDTFFIKTLSYIDKKNRNHWQTLQDIALGKDPNNKIGTILFFIRNKISSHYDRKEISKGYSKFFIENQITEPYISRGANMAKSRFYFADAAIEKYTKDKFEEININLNDKEKLDYDDCMNEISSLLDKLNFSLFKIVTTFIQNRSCWKKPSLKD